MSTSSTNFAFGVTLAVCNVFFLYTLCQLKSPADLDELAATNLDELATATMTAATIIFFTCQMCASREVIDSTLLSSGAVALASVAASQLTPLVTRESLSVVDVIAPAVISSLLYATARTVLFAGTGRPQENTQGRTPTVNAPH